MKIAVEGCAHGELEIIYNAIVESEKIDGKKVDLLLCCGDFQSTRNWSDLACMNVPDKFKDMGSFYKYYSGEKIAPVLTIFIGGNHEASNYLQELAYGGWVAPNIYYLGYAGVVNVGGIRIAGLSGIYKTHDLMKGHHEFPPYNSSTIRSSYHIRNLEVFRLKQISGNIDIFMTHDWPLGITRYGNVNALLKSKPFFKNDIQSDNLGSPPAMELLKHHYPSYWFSAHLHCKFVACVTNDDNSKRTKFLALDKCLPKRKFLQIIEINTDKNLPIQLTYDLEWLTVLLLTNHLLSVKSSTCYMPGPGGGGRWNFTPTEQEKQRILQKLDNTLSVPLNFKESIKPFDPEFDPPNCRQIDQPNLSLNNQTTEFCNKLAIDDPFALLKVMNSISSDEVESQESISIASSTPSKQTDSLSAEVSDEQDEEQENFVIDTCPTAVDKKPSMTPLKLPVARNDSTISLSSDESYQNSSKSPRTLDQMLENIGGAVDDQVICSSSSKQQVEQPNNKKFKRRNQSIYVNAECAT